MAEELTKAYDPQIVELNIYKLWESINAFAPQGNGKPFVIVIPPPNVTGNLHMGHALDNTLQDICIRYHRMKGDLTLWVPGTDHAGIATQNVVEKELKKEGKRKEDLGRELFLKKVWEWKEKYGVQIINQLKRLGATCDWSRERFTMDEGLSAAVRHEFVTLYNKGLIYRGKRIINWCPRCHTALSDIETEYENKNGKLWHIRYPYADGKGYVIVATTRPETMLGDTAVAVNPKDERYASSINRKLLLPLVNRIIPIIKDDFVEATFGTGAVKVTPAHDPNDFEIGIRHNLPKINMLYPDARIQTTEFAKEEQALVLKYEGLDRFKARDMIVTDLETMGLIEKIEDYSNSVGHCYRCKTMVEPYLSDQWFVAVKELAAPAIKAVEDGKIKFTPSRWNKVYLNWMRNLKDWCISRQLWWGHQIPVWYCECGEMIVAENTPKTCPKCQSSRLTQDPDVFDTWFSSALWPFSVFNWPKQTEDLKTFYPTSVLITAYDILTFWVSRMIMMGIEFMGQEPFNTVFIHGLVKDISGKKMSKSIGNVIDPLEVINHVGADALRFSLTSFVTGQGQDIKLNEDKIKEARNFANKIWNVSRFILMNLDINEYNLPAKEKLSTWDKWILSRYNEVIQKVSESIENYAPGEAARMLYDFLWSEFCDWYIEVSKSSLNQKNTAKSKDVQKILMHILQGTLKLLHPIMPFITEEIWQKLPKAINNKALIVSAWPIVDQSLIDHKLNSDIEMLMNIVRSIRNLRAEMQITPDKKADIILVEPSGNYAQIIDESIDVLKLLAGLNTVKLVKKLNQPPQQSAMSVIEGIEIYMPLENLIDLNKENDRLTKEKEKIELELNRINARLNDDKFLSKAPQESIDEQHEKKRALEEKHALIEQRIKFLKTTQ